jgi:lysozyme family protein
VEFLDRLIEALGNADVNTKPTLTAAPVVEDKRSTFEIAIEKVLKEEGGYANNERDPGGETKYGISKRAHPHLDIKNLSLDTAKKIYYDEYWLPTGAKVDHISPFLAAILFDTAVNMGVPTAIRLLQKAVHTKEDGKLGPLTMEAVEQNKDVVAERLLVLRMRRYSELPTWETFKGGWMSRMIRLSLSNINYSGDKTV